MSHNSFTSGSTKALGLLSLRSEKQMLILDGKQHAQFLEQDSMLRRCVQQLLNDDAGFWHDISPYRCRSVMQSTQTMPCTQVALDGRAYLCMTDWASIEECCDAGLGDGRMWKVRSSKDLELGTCKETSSKSRGG